MTVLQGSGPLYARDIIAAPLRRLEETIEKIRLKHFSPDQSRSGMLTPVAPAASAFTPMAAGKVSGPQTPIDLTQIAPKVEVIEDTIIISDDEHDFLAASEHSSSDSDDDEFESSSDEDEKLKAIAPELDKRRKRLRCIPASTLFFMHKKSKIFHCRDGPLTEGSGPNFLECGRKLSGNFEQKPKISAADQQCSLCFKKTA